MTTSSSAPARRAACSRPPVRGSRDARLPDRGGFLGSPSLHPRAGAGGRGDRGAGAELALHDRRRRPRSTTAASRCRAGASSAARARSTAWCTSAASRGTTTTGRRRATPGWSWREVLPYFLRSEDNDGLPRARRTTAQGGPICVSHIRKPNPLNQSFLEAFAAVGGYPRLRRLHRPETGGLRAAPGHHPRRPARFDREWPICGRRRRRANLKVLTRALVTRVLDRATAARVGRRGAESTAPAPDRWRSGKPCSAPARSSRRRS